MIEAELTRHWAAYWRAAVRRMSRTRREYRLGLRALGIAP